MFTLDFQRANINPISNMFESKYIIVIYSVVGEKHRHLFYVKKKYVRKIYLEILSFKEDIKRNINHSIFWKTRWSE